MSLIQEALRRRGDETGVPLALKPPVEVVPPPLPPPPPKSKHAGLWVVAVLLLGLGVGGAVWFWAVIWVPRQQAIAAATLVKQAEKPPAAKPPAVQPAPPSPPPVIAKTVAPTNPPATNNIIAKVQATLEKTITPERRELVVAATNAPVVLPPLPVSTAAVPVVVQAIPAAPPTPPPPRKVVRWPKLTVTGVMARSGGHAMAFVNGRMVGGDDELLGVKIVQVTADGVRFAYQDETNFLRVGHSTE
jgi:hypothetical protein